MQHTEITPVGQPLWGRIGLSVATVVAAAVAVGALGAAPVAAATKKRTKTTVRVPRHGDPCTTRAANYRGTALDCVEVPGKGLQWRIRGTVHNPFRLNEPVELYQLQSSRVRVVLSQWDADVTDTSTSLGYDPTPAKAPGTALLAYRAEVTLVASGPGARNLASDSFPAFVYVIGPNVREDQARALSDRSVPGAIADQRACPGPTLFGFPATSAKKRLEALQVGESGYDDLCKEVPADQTANAVVEVNLWTKPGGPNAKTAISVYFSGTPR